MFFNDKITRNATHSILSRTCVEALVSFPRRDNKVQGSMLAFSQLLSSAHSSSHILEQPPISHIQPVRRSTFSAVAIATSGSLSLPLLSKPSRLTFRSHRHRLRPMQLLSSRFLFLSSPLPASPVPPTGISSRSSATRSAT